MKINYVEISKKDRKLLKKDSEALREACEDVQEEMAVLAFFHQLSEVDKLEFARNMKTYPMLRKKVDYATTQRVEEFVTNLQTLKDFCGIEEKVKKKWFSF